MLSDDVVEAYYKQVPGAAMNEEQGGYAFPCSSQLPSLTITISGYNAVISGNLLNFQSVGGGSCLGGLQSSQGTGMNIFGDIFLKSQYVVFSSDGPKLGFAPQA